MQEKSVCEMLGKMLLWDFCLQLQKAARVSGGEQAHAGAARRRARDSTRREARQPSRMAELLRRTTQVRYKYRIGRFEYKYLASKFANYTAPMYCPRDDLRS
eukprot:6205895-Pleurochrysis_carterae.AAC.1